MSPQPTTTKEPLDAGVTSQQIQQLIDERVAAGASGCQVVTEGGQRFLVCQWPPP
jgi:galactokinase/mevalonate kinase-like predicted kinase